MQCFDDEEIVYTQLYIVRIVYICCEKNEREKL